MAGCSTATGYDRLIYQPDERPTEPMAMPDGASADTFDDIGGYLPTLAGATAANAEGAMASDSPSLARWFRSLCAGQVVSAASLDEMTDFDERPDYGLGIIDRRGEYGRDSGALGHTGAIFGFTTVALCFPTPASSSSCWRTPSTTSFLQRPGCHGPLTSCDPSGDQYHPPWSDLGLARSSREARAVGREGVDAALPVEGDRQPDRWPATTRGSST